MHQAGSQGVVPVVVVRLVCVPVVVVRLVREIVVLEMVTVVAEVCVIVLK